MVSAKERPEPDLPEVLLQPPTQLALYVRENIRCFCNRCIYEKCLG